MASRSLDVALQVARASRVVTVSRVKPTDVHDGQKAIKLIGKVEGSPEACWKTRTVYVADIVSGRLTLEGEKAKLIADCEEYHDNYVALQVALKDL